MAFDGSNFAPLSAIANDDCGKVWTYKEAATLAAMRASGYFDNAIDYGIAADDAIMLFGSDGIGFSQVNISGTTVTLNENITSV